MKKSNKVLLIAGLATATIGTVGILHTNYRKYPEEIATKMQTYNHQPDNILDNVFEKDNVTYLPFIFDNADQRITKEKIIAEFAKKGLTVTSELKAEVGTGTQIKVKENSNVYTVIVYGDVNGDGKVNLIDAQVAILHHKGTRKLTGPYLMVGNVSNETDNIINLIDAQRIIMFKKGKLKQLVVVEPTSLKEADKIAPVITIKGDKTIELEEGAAYIDEGATALDNYDGDLTSEISRIIEFVAEGTTQKVKVGQVDTSKVGTYTITYSVVDSNNNPSAAIRTVIIKAKEVPPIPEKAVESIELSLDANFKTEYQYGEATTLDLTGAKIVVTYEDKTTDTINVTKSMLSAYDLTAEGQKEITVTYGEKTAPTKINVKVLKPISELVMTNTGMNNVQEIVGGYQTNSKEDFVLGTIQAKQETDGSTLQQSQLKITTSVTPTEDSTVTANNLSVNFETDASGNIIIKGKAEKVGEYTIKAYIEYGSQKVEKAIKLVVKKSDVVKEVKVEPIDENEVIKVGSVAKRKLTVININDEEIEVTSGNLEISEITGVTITKLDENGILIGGSHQNTKVASLQIVTTLEDAQSVTVNMTVNKKPVSFSFEVKAKSILTSFEIAEDVLNVYAVLPNNPNVVPGQSVNGKRNFYTLIEPTFKDQYGETMTAQAKDIVDSIYQTEIDAAVQAGQVAVQFPQVRATLTVNIPDLGEIVDVRDNETGIDLKCFDSKGIMQDGANEITKLGFSIILNEEGKVVDLSTLNGKKVIVKLKDITKELTIRVNYKDLTNLSINTLTASIEQDSEKNYITKLNEEFTLGMITVGEGETPVTADMLSTEIIGDATGISIKYENDADGNIIVKGTVLKEGLYQIIPKVGEIKSIIRPKVKGISIPEISNINIDNFEVQIGEQTQKDFVAISDINPTGQPIKAKEITFKQEDQSGTIVNDLEIQLLDERNLPIYTEPVGDGQGNNAARPDVIVKKINVKAKETIAADKQIKLTMTIFKDEENEYSKAITVSTYQPIPRGIVIGNTVNLYDTHVEGTTVQSNGLIYTLLPVELFASSDNTRKISAKKDYFTEAEADKEAKVYIKQPSVELYIDGAGIGDFKEELVIEYFGEDKLPTSSDVAYIGIAMANEEDPFSYNKLDFNGKQIKLICGDATEDAPTATITLNYTENN